MPAWPMERYLSTDDGTVDTLGGYRLVRRLGFGTRSDVWLGSDGAVTAAIKVFHPGAPRDRIDAEIESLGRASGRHLIQLEDLAMGPDGSPCLILQRLSQWSLGRILEGCRPRDGEAVTILAPLSLAVAELHRVGVVHGKIRASSVLFDGAGAPVLASFGDAELMGDMPLLPTSFSVPPSTLKCHPGVIADVDALAALGLATLNPETDVGRWLAGTRDRDPTCFAAELAERLFRFTEASPVHFSTRGLGDGDALIPLRMTIVHEFEPRALTANDDESASPPSAPCVSTMGSITAFMHLPEGMAASVNDWVAHLAESGPLAGMARKVKESLKPVRKSVWIIAGLVAAGVVAAVAILPVNSHHGLDDTAVMPSMVIPTHSSEPHTPEWTADIRGDDPLAAVSALLDAREKCFDASSVLCLDDVDQQGSAAMDADAAHVRMLQDDGAADGSATASDSNAQGGELGAPTTSIVERLGDSVLLSLTFGDASTPSSAFSLLLIKSSEGWRIRDLVPVVKSELESEY